MASCWQASSSLQLWPTYMAEDNRVLIRVDDNIYQQRLDRITEGPIGAAVMSEIARKYFDAPATAISGGSVWLLEVVDN